MRLHARRFVLGSLTTALLIGGAAPAAANPFGTQNPLGHTQTNDVLTSERPAIAAGNGRSLVVWRERIEIVSLGRQFGWQIGGRLVDGSGVPVSDAFFIGDGCCSRPSRPDVTYNAARNEFLVVVALQIPKGGVRLRAACRRRRRAAGRPSR